MSHGYTGISISPEHNTLCASEIRTFNFLMLTSLWDFNFNHNLYLQKVQSSCLSAPAPSQDAKTHPYFVSEPFLGSCSPPWAPQSSFCPYHAPWKLFHRWKVSIHEKYFIICILLISIFCYLYYVVRGKGKVLFLICLDNEMERNWQKLGELGREQ